MLKGLLQSQWFSAIRTFYLGLRVSNRCVSNENQDHADIDKFFDMLDFVCGCVCRLRQVGFKEHVLALTELIKLISANPSEQDILNPEEAK